MIAVCDWRTKRVAASVTARPPRRRGGHYSTVLYSTVLLTVLEWHCRLAQKARHCRENRRTKTEGRRNSIAEAADPRAPHFDVSRRGDSGGEMRDRARRRSPPKATRRHSVGGGGRRAATKVQAFAELFGEMHCARLRLGSHSTPSAPCDAARAPGVRLRAAAQFVDVFRANGTARARHPPRNNTMPHSYCPLSSPHVREEHAIQ